MADGKGEYKIRLTTEADLKGAKELDKALTSATAKTKEISRESSKPQTLGGFISNLRASVAARLAGIGIAAGAAAKALKEYASAEASVGSLDAALRQRVLLTDQYREKLQGLAATLEKQTAIQSSDWLQVLSTLTKFGAGPENIERITEGVKNLAGVLGGDINQAANILARAMNGNTTALSRFGFKINESLPQAERFNDLLQQIANRGGGQLEARLNTLNGKWDALKIALSNVSQNIGGVIAQSGLLQFWLDKTASTATKLSDAMGGTIPVAGELENAMTDLPESFDDTADSAETAAEKINLVKKAADEASDALNREKDALEQQSNQTIKMIQANAKLELAKIESAEKRGMLTPQQAAVAKAQVESRKEGAIFSEQQRLDRQIVSKNKMEMDKLNSDLLKKEAELSAKEDEASRFGEGARLKNQATRARSAVDNFMREFGDQINQPGFGEYETARQELLKQRDLLEGRARAAEAEAEPFATVTSESAAALKEELNQLRLELKTLRESGRTQTTRLDAETRAKEAELTGRAAVFGIERRTMAFSGATSAFEAGGGLPNINRNPADIARQSALQARQVQMDVVTAIRQRDVDTANANLLILESLRANARDVASLRAAVAILNRQTANRPPQ